MQMELVDQSVVINRVRYVGSGTYNVSAGQTLKMETSPGGVDILEAEVPAGKSWAVSIEVNIVETDI